MEEKFKRIEELIGEDALNRVFEVMKIFGISFPKSFDIYWSSYIGGLFDRCTLNKLYDHWSNLYAVALSDSEKPLDYVKIDILDKLGYFRFNKYTQEIAFIKDGVFFKWYRNKDGHEELNISKDKRDNYENNFTIFFNRRNEGISTSDIGTSHNHKTIITSYVTSVNAVDFSGKTESVSIDNYFELFKRVLNGHSFNFIIPERLKQYDLIGLIVKIFEQPIKGVVYDIMNNDQSWRYESEANCISSRCEAEKRRAKEVRDETVNNADELYEYEVGEAEKNKESQIAQLEKLKNDYLSKKNGASMNLTKKDS